MSEYKLVPVEPTWEMTNAASENSDVNSFIDINNVYKAMLSASPTTDTVTIGSAKYEAMKADAERYRAIRIFGSGMRVVFGNYPNINIHDVKNNLCGDDLDPAIDQARKV